MLYGRPTKHVRVHYHVNQTIEPQRFIIIPFWKYKDTATTRTDGLDIQDNVLVPEGSRINKHKIDLLVTPETIEPQQLYIGRIKLSFNDVMSPAVCGGRFNQASYQDTATEDFDVESNAITPHFFPFYGATDNKIEVSTPGVSTQNEIGGSGSGYGIQEWLLDDHIKHFINLKKVTVFDQRPLMGERWQRIPSKVKRINEGTFYGLFIFNDSPRGATPADTQVTVDLKSYFEETAI